MLPSDFVKMLLAQFQTFFVPFSKMPKFQNNKWWEVAQKNERNKNHKI